MQVSVEQIPNVALGTRGILVRVRDEHGKNLGKLWIGQATVRWAAGNIPENNAKRLSVKAFVDYRMGLVP